ncbi:OB-fold protein [Saccharicrinis sp. GN24d3]|uniref:OB-fold protein n=1 Tax=Saccharicrinis sp. GN24d3 TaxID=3458416 RepID=UPI004036E403
MNKKRILILFAGVMLAVAVIGFYQFNKPHKNYEKAKVEVTISANLLHDTFNSDEQKANREYLNKIIEVSGQPVSYDHNANGSVTICLEDEFMGVSCTFDSLYVVKNYERFKWAQKAELLKIKGRCDGFLTDVRLSKCSFIPMTHQNAP